MAEPKSTTPMWDWRVETSEGDSYHLRSGEGPADPEGKTEGLALQVFSDFVQMAVEEAANDDLMAAEIVHLVLHYRVERDYETIKEGMNMWLLERRDGCVHYTWHDVPGLASWPEVPARWGGGAIPLPSAVT